MNKRAHDALAESILVWRKRVEILEANLRKPMPEIRMGGDCCPLCKEFGKNCCFGCPVFANTGLADCVRTPYNKARNARYFGIVSEYTIKAFKAEQNYLMSLVEEVKE